MHDARMLPPARRGVRVIRVHVDVSAAQACHSLLVPQTHLSDHISNVAELARLHGVNCAALDDARLAVYVRSQKLKLELTLELAAVRVNARNLACSP